MPKLLVQADYTTEGLQGLAANGAAGRIEAVRRAVEALGGTLEAFYWSFGEHHVVGIIDMPDDAAAAGLALAIMRAGQVRVSSTQLYTAEDVDAGLARAPQFRPPAG